MKNNVINVEKLGIYERVPSDINDVLDKKQITKIENILSKKNPQIKMIKGELYIVLNNAILAKLSVKVDKRQRKFVLVVE